MDFNANIIFKELGISEVDVENEEDREVLIRWKSQLDKVIASMSVRVTELKQMYKNGSVADSSEYIRLTRVKKLYGVLSNKMQNRIREIRLETNQTKEAFFKTENEKKTLVKNEKAMLIALYFQQVAKEELIGKQYTEIIIEAKKRLAKAHPDLIL